MNTQENIFHSFLLVPQKMQILQLGNGICLSLCKEAEGKLTAGQTKTTRSQEKKVKEVGVARKKQEILRHVSKIN